MPDAKRSMFVFCSDICSSFRQFVSLNLEIDESLVEMRRVSTLVNKQLSKVIFATYLIFLNCRCVATLVKASCTSTSVCILAAVMTSTAIHFRWLRCASVSSSSATRARLLWTKTHSSWLTWPASTQATSNRINSEFLVRSEPQNYKHYTKFFSHIYVKLIIFFRR